MEEDVLFRFFRDPLRAEAHDATKPLNDPEASKRAAGDHSPFITVDAPQTGVFYPHVIVEKAGGSLTLQDRRSQFFGGPLDVDIHIRASRKKHAAEVFGGVLHWVASNVQALNRQGFNDVRITSTPAATWNSGTRVFERIISVQGDVFVCPE